MADAAGPAATEVSPLSIENSVSEGVITALRNARIRVRPNVAQADASVLNDTYTKMQARTENDNRGWVYWAEYHGYNRYDCWHHFRLGNNQYPYDLFLPWHRAYLTYFEQTARDWNPSFVLPWWDWTSALSHQQGLPAAYTNSADPALESGPLPQAFSPPRTRTRRGPSTPASLPTPAQVTAALALTDYVDFSNQLQNIHDQVHGWVGGDMGVIAASAFDPIFWSHHCMIDRIWYLWQLRHGVNSIPPIYMDKTLAPWDLTVGDVLDTHRLGYEYAASRIIVSSPRFTAVPVGAAH